MRETINLIKQLVNGGILSAFKNSEVARQLKY